MKKRTLISMLILLLVMTGMFTGCTPEPEELLTAPVKIGSLNGPTGIGMVKLLEDPDKYQVTLYQSPDEVVGKIISGEVDVAAVPSNLAAVLYNNCLLYTSDAADEEDSVDLGGRRIIKKKKTNYVYQP